MFFFSLQELIEQLEQFEDERNVLSMWLLRKWKNMKQESTLKMSWKVYELYENKVNRNSWIFKITFMDLVVPNFVEKINTTIDLLHGKSTQDERKVLKND